MTVIALTPEYITDYDDPQGVDFRTAVGDVAVFTIPGKLRVHHVAVTVTEDIAGANTPVIDFDKRLIAGTDTGRGNGDVATIPLGLAVAGENYYLKPKADIFLEPGEEIVVKMAQPLTATPEGGFTGHCRFFIWAELSGELVTNLEHCIEVS